MISELKCPDLHVNDFCNISDLLSFFRLLKDDKNYELSCHEELL